MSNKDREGRKRGLLNAMYLPLKITELIQDVLGL